MKMKFVELFKKYGYIVEKYGNGDTNSYIADNGVFCIPFTEHECPFPMISGVSFLSCDKEGIIKKYKDEGYIGCKVFSDLMNNRLPFFQFGGICNNDHDYYEVEEWLRRCSKEK